MTDQHGNKEMARQKLERPIHPEADIAYLRALTVRDETDQVLTIARYTDPLSLRPCQVSLQRPKAFAFMVTPTFPEG